MLTPALGMGFTLGKEIDMFLAIFIALACVGGGVAYVDSQDMAIDRASANAKVYVIDEQVEQKYYYIKKPYQIKTTKTIEF